MPKPISWPLKKTKNRHEHHLQRAIWEYLSLNGILAWICFQPDTKSGFRSYQHPSSVGVSDILGIFKTCPLAIEVKYGYNKPTPQQKLFLERIRSEGGIAFVAYSIDDVKKELHL